MSLLNVNKIDPATGTALEIGTSGDTITVPSGATFNVAGTLQSGGAALGNNTPCFGAKATSNQTGLTSGGWTKIQFDTAIFNVGSGYDTTNDKFVVPAGEGGKYFFTASAKINAGSYNLMGTGIRLTVGGSAAAGLEEINFLYNGSGATAYSEGKNCNGILDLSAAAEVEVYAYYQHTAGTAGTITGVTTEIDTFFFGYKLAE